MFNALVQERVLEVEDETAGISNEALFEASVDLESTYAEFDDLARLSTTLDDLEHLRTVIGTHGVTESLLAFTNRDKLLSTVIPAFGACESLGADALVGSVEAIAALEAVDETIKETTDGWFKRAWDAIVGVGGKISEFAKRAYDKVVDAAKWVGNKVYNAAKAAKEVITAHPIASVLALLGVVASTAAIVSAIWGIPLPVSGSAIGAWKNQVVKAISSGAGSTWKGIVSITDKGVSVVKGAGTAVKNGTGTALGYTQEAYGKVTGAVKAAFGEGGAIPKSATFVKEHASSLLEKAKRGGSAALSAARAALSWLIGITKSLWRFASGPAFGAVTNALNSFKGLFASKEVVEAYSQHHVKLSSSAQGKAAAAAA